MSLGTRYELTGILLEQRGELVLEVAGGGSWRLDVGRKARRLIGVRVNIIGTRDGFDLLGVKQIKRA